VGESLCEGEGVRIAFCVGLERKGRLTPGELGVKFDGAGSAVGLGGRAELFGWEKTDPNGDAAESLKGPAAGGLGEGCRFGKSGVELWCELVKAVDGAVGL